MIYKGKDIAKMTADELRSFRKEVQIIFQDPYSSLNPRMTIGNAIMEPMQVHDILENDEQRKEKVKELLTKVIAILNIISCCVYRKNICGITITNNKMAFVINN